MGQHLSRRHVRHPEPPLQLFVRAQPRLVARLLAASRDPGLSREGRRRSRRARPLPLRRRAARGRVGRRGSAVAGPYVGGRADQHHVDQRDRRAVGSQAPGHRRHRDLRRPPVPHRAVGPRRRPGRQTSGRDRHRRVGHPGSAGDPAGGRPPRRLPALGGLGDPARRPPVHGVAAAKVPAVPRPPARPQGPALLLPRGAGPRHHPLAAAEPPCRDARPSQPRQRRRGPRRSARS